MGRRRLVFLFVAVASCTLKAEDPLTRDAATNPPDEAVVFDARLASVDAPLAPPDAPLAPPDAAVAFDAPPPAPPVGTDGCNQLLACVLACPDADDTCATACYESGSAGAQAKLDALLQCLIDAMCADATCAQNMCGAEITACLEDTDTPPDGGPPITQGGIAPELVGDWFASSASYTFRADGTYIHVNVYEADVCIAFRKLVITQEGLAATAGDQLTLSVTGGQTETTSCSGTTTVKPATPRTTQETWRVDGNTLTLIDDGGPARVFTRE